MLLKADGFVVAASGSDQYEIMAARLARTASNDPTIRAFATETIQVQSDLPMIEHHLAAVQSLMREARGAGHLNGAVRQEGLNPKRTSAPGV